ncbi:MAG TPA: hypothetical protein VGF28_26125 [Thermoanaerobaculia bacterium]
MFLAPLILLASILHAGPERAVAPPVPESPYSQRIGDVAAAGDVALAVWQEPAGIRAARFDRDGRRLDAQPLHLSATSSSPVVVRGDGNWLVAWSDVTGVSWRFIEHDGRGTAGERNGVAAPPTINTVAAAFDGRHFLIAWTSAEGIGAVRLDARGAVVEHSISIPPRGFFVFLNVVAFDGGGFGVVAVQSVYSDATGSEYTVEAYRLDTNADLQSFGWLDRTSSSDIRRLQVLADGDRFVAAWTEAAGRLFVAREGEPLRVIATGLAPVDIVKIGGAVYVLAIAGDGTTMLISEDGAARRTVGTNAQQDARAAVFGDRVLVAMTTEVVDETDISTTVVDTALQEVRPQERVTSEPALQLLPAIARNNFGESLVAWLENGRADGAAVMGARLDAAGRPLGAPFRIALTRPYSVSVPHVASDGTDFLVVDYGAGVRMHRVLRDGTVQAPVELATSGTETCVAWTGTEYLVGHTRTLILTRQRRDVEIRAARVSREGVLGETFVVAPEVTYFQAFDCAAGDAATLFAWTARGSIEGTLVSDAGPLSGVIHIRNSTGVFGPWGTIGVTANGNTFLTFWNDTDSMLRWATVNEHGTVSFTDEHVPFEAVEPRLKPADAAPFESGFVLVWGTRTLRALTLDAGGRILATSTLPATPALARGPSLAGGNDVLAVYMRSTGGGETVPLWRVFARSLDDTAPRRRVVRH